MNLDTQTPVTVMPSRLFGWRAYRLPRDAGLGYLLVLPIVVLLLGLVGYPFVLAIWQSLHWKLIGVQEAPFIGLGNYIDSVKDPIFRHSVFITVLYTLVAQAGKVSLGLMVALILNQRLPIRSFLRGVVILPWALPTVASALTFMWMLSGGYGVFNYVLRQLHLITTNINWLSSPDLALWAVTGVNIWRGFPFFAICLLAGLQSISQELHEAASVDGASAIDRFWHITIPGIIPVLTVTSLLSAIWTINDFTLIWVMTQGGPSTATTVLPVLTYRAAFLSLELGKGVAVSVALVPLVVVLIFLLVRTLSRAEER
ncbi:MAG: sugar ABC transporter permease [Chloroflexi bacterium]|nr:sugar ABC transporter permease [Chloroflexota bacterium]